MLSFESRLHKHNRSARHIEFTSTLEYIDMEVSDEDVEASDEGAHGHMQSYRQVTEYGDLLKNGNAYAQKFHRLIH